MTHGIEPTPTPPHRGTIIVDASVLLGLSGPIPNAMKSPSAPSDESCLKALKFLASHGYRILIPEMVSIKVGGVFASGETLPETIWPGAVSVPQQELRELRRLLCDAAKPESDPDKQSKGLQIVASTGPPEVNAFVAAVHNAATTNYGNPSYGRYAEANYNGRENLRDLVLKNFKAQYQEEWGNNAVIELRHSLSVQKLKPIVLVRNKDLRDAVQGPKLSIGKLFYLLGESGIATHMGFKDTDGTSLRDQALRHILKIPEERMVAVDSATVEPLKDSNFFKSLQTLAEDLKQQAAAPLAAPSTAVHPRAADFAKKFGHLGDPARRTGSTGSTGTPGAGR